MSAEIPEVSFETLGRERIAGQENLPLLLQGSFRQELIDAGAKDWGHVSVAGGSDADGSVHLDFILDLTAENIGLSHFNFEEKLMLTASDFSLFQFDATDEAREALGFEKRGSFFTHNEARFLVAFLKRQKGQTLPERIKELPIDMTRFDHEQASVSEALQSIPESIPEDRARLPLVDATDDRFWERIGQSVYSEHLIDSANDFVEGLEILRQRGRAPTVQELSIYTARAELFEAQTASFNEMLNNHVFNLPHLEDERFALALMVQDTESPSELELVAAGALATTHPAKLATLQLVAHKTHSS